MSSQTVSTARRPVIDVAYGSFLVGGALILATAAFGAFVPANDTEGAAFGFVAAFLVFPAAFLAFAVGIVLSILCRRWPLLLLALAFAAVLAAFFGDWGFEAVVVPFAAVSVAVPILWFAYGRRKSLQSIA